MLYSPQKVLSYLWRRCTTGLLFIASDHAAPLCISVIIVYVTKYQPLIRTTVMQLSVMLRHGSNVKKDSEQHIIMKTLLLLHIK